MWKTQQKIEKTHIKKAIESALTIAADNGATSISFDVKAMFTNQFITEKYAVDILSTAINFRKW